jgi:5-methylcytosine-specific restriction endonuclease McrA
MSERIRLGNTYHHDEHGEVLTVHRDHENQVWFRCVESKDNAGVIRTGPPRTEDYKTFLGSVTMRDYPEDDEWQARRKAVFERDDYTCQGCGQSGDSVAQLHCHHICPLGAGGSNARSNLITLCDECHGRVHGGTT